MTRTRTATAPPARVGAAAKKSNRHQAADDLIIPAPTENVETAGAALRNMLPPSTFALVVVETSRPGDPERFRRKLFLTLPPAQRAVEDARARGQQASALLVELHPVGVLGSGAL